MADSRLLAFFDFNGMYVNVDNRTNTCFTEDQLENLANSGLPSAQAEL